MRERRIRLEQGERLLIDTPQGTIDIDADPFKDSLATLVMVIRQGQPVTLRVVKTANPDVAEVVLEGPGDY